MLHCSKSIRRSLSAKERNPMIIGVLNQKGGVGKTTVAINMAASLAHAGERVLLIDADPQGSAMAWSSTRESEPPFSIVGMAKPTLHRDLPAAARQGLRCRHHRRRAAGQRSRPLGDPGQR